MAGVGGDGHDAAYPRASIIVWRLAQVRQRAWSVLGGPGVVTLLAVTGFVAAIGLDLHMVRRLEAARAALAALQLAAAQQTEAAASSVVSADRVASFAQVLPAYDDIPQCVQDLLRLAEDQGLLIRRGDYRLRFDDAGEFWRYEMTLPVQGDARAIESFVSQALAGQPALALERLQVERTESPGGGLDARVEWVLFVASPAAGKAPIFGGEKP